MGGVEFTAGIAVVFGLILIAAVLFMTNWIPSDVTAVAIIVLLAVFEPWTEVTPLDAISGFASPATVTVLAMFILSEGIRQTGLVERVGRRLAPITRRSPRRQLAVILGLGGLPAGLFNNTPLVAVLTPLVIDLSKRHRRSPSSFLMPLSFIAMMGGTLTLIGSSTNILASDLSARLLGRPIAMFEFTALGLLVLTVGAAYLLTIGRRLVPERILPEEDLTQKFQMRPYLRGARVPGASPLVGKTLHDSEAGDHLDLDILQIARGGRRFLGPSTDLTVEAGDVFIVRADARMIEAFASARGLELHEPESVTDRSFVDSAHTLVEATIGPESQLLGETLISSDFRRHYGGTVLAIQRGEKIIPDRIETYQLKNGDSLLLLMDRTWLPHLDATPGMHVTRHAPREALFLASRRAESEVKRVERRRRTARVLTIIGIVVLLPTLNVLPIYISALAGMVLMVATGCLKSSAAYGSVSWNIVFLLAGMIPLGIAMDRTGAARFLASGVVALTDGLPAVAVLGIFYLLTALLTNVISNNATVVLMIPVAVSAALEIDANPFAFVLAVMFAASTAFMTPQGYQTSLMVYAPGGYRFSDYARVGAPLQFLLAVVTIAGIAFIWGV